MCLQATFHALSVVWHARSVSSCQFANQSLQDIFLSESMLLELEPPFVVVGGMHGSFVQLLQLFERCGDLPETRYLFLGGYVDLGQRSLDTISLLFLHKIQHPRNMVLLRSKHEESRLLAKHAVTLLGRSYALRNRKAVEA